MITAGACRGNGTIRRGAGLAGSTEVEIGAAADVVAEGAGGTTGRRPGQDSHRDIPYVDTTTPEKTGGHVWC